MPQAAQQHIDQADSARRLGAVGIRDADATVKARIDHGGRRRSSQIARRRTDVVGRHVAHRLGPLGRPGDSRPRQLIKARGIAGHKVAIVQVLGNQNVGNTQQQGQVAARAHAQPAVGKRGRTAATRIHHNNLGPATSSVVQGIDCAHRRRIHDGAPQVHDAIGMGQVGCRAVAQAVLPTGQAAHLASAIGTIHVGRSQRVHKTIGPITVERGHAERHAQRTGAMRVRDPAKACRDLSKRLVPAHRIEPRTILAAAHGMQDTVALVKRHGQAMPPASAQGPRRTRVPRHR